MESTYKTDTYDVPVEILVMESGSAIVTVKLDWSRLYRNFDSNSQIIAVVDDFLIHVARHSVSGAPYHGEQWQYHYETFEVRTTYLYNTADCLEPPSTEPALRQEAVDNINLLCDSGMDITNVNTSLGEEYGKVIIQFKRKK